MRMSLTERHKTVLIIYGIEVVVFLFAFIVIAVKDGINPVARFAALLFFFFLFFSCAIFWLKEFKEYKRLKKLGL